MPRDRFVDGPRAWENVALGIGHGQTISQPLVVARMCELLALRGDERVLDVGTGSGYHAAVLSHLAGEVVGVEVVPELARAAAERLADRPTVRVVEGDGTRGDLGTFDAINVAAAGPRKRLDALVASLVPGGRLVAPVERRGRGQVLTVITADGDQAHDRVRFVPLS